MEECKYKKKIKIAQTYTRAIMTAFKSDTRQFGWGSLINIVHFNNSGEHTSSLRNFTESTTEEVKKQTCQTWGNTTTDFNDDINAQLNGVFITPETEPTHIPRFYCRVCTGMIAKRISGSLYDACLNNLILKIRDFTWINQDIGVTGMDGPTMLQIIVQGNH